MAIRRVLCGSSVYVQKKWSCSFSNFGSCCSSALTVKPRGAGFFEGTVAVETEDRMVAAVRDNCRFRVGSGGAELEVWFVEYAWRTLGLGA